MEFYVNANYQGRKNGWIKRAKCIWDGHKNILRNMSYGAYGWIRLLYKRNHVAIYLLRGQWKPDSFFDFFCLFVFSYI